MRWLREAGVECTGGRAKRGPRSEMEGLRKKEKTSHFKSRVFHHKWTTSTHCPLAEAHNRLHSYANY